MANNKKIKCPVCGGRILFHRCNDDDVYVPITPDGEIGDAIEGKQNGYSEWVCEVDATHNVSPINDLLEPLFDDAQTAAF